MSLSSLAVLVTSLMLITWVVVTPPPESSIEVRVSASSTAAGYDPMALIPSSGDGSARQQLDGAVAWRSADETVGAWVELTTRRPRAVNRLSLDGVAQPLLRPTSVLLTFDGGSPLLVTADVHGDAEITFSPRTASAVRVTVAGASEQSTSVGLASIWADSSGTPDTTVDPAPPVVATASSTGRSPAASLVDGNLSSGDPGGEWHAAADDSAPWVQLAWSAAHEVASVQVLGPSAAVTESAAQTLRGELHFSDGSSVVVSGVAGDEGPTTVAFAPRMSSWVRLELEPEPDGAISLREFVAYRAGVTPPTWPEFAPGRGYATEAPVAERCDQATLSGMAAPGSLRLVCPPPGAAVEGVTRIVVAGTPGTELQAVAWSAEDAQSLTTPRPVALVTVGTSGHAALEVDMAMLPHGPVTLEISALGLSRAYTTPLSVQLFNRAGLVVKQPDHAPPGMTLQWSEEFREPLSVSASGRGAQYAASKPEPGGSSQFGDAVFADPATGTQTLSTLEGEYLRIRAQPIGVGVTASWGQQHESGLLSSFRVGASGFSAQYGYFEARLMGAPGAGTWPAFWMLNSEAAARDTGTAAEVDAVELYGHNPRGSCHTLHSWNDSAPAPPPENDGAPRCRATNGFTDWTMTWHTYGVRIVPGGAIFFIDGHEVGTRSGLIHTDQPFFFLINLALGGGWPVDLSSTQDTSDLYVDWVRVYT
ncbi:DUF7402 domain-containing protein [Blastococcus saxobsidens]|uniref:DUF7402 domain-containing protein n=1 Tax=Blastococcus saxobsidens TaxID=138336 RepID=UPI0013152FEC|nr:family 16 glycosylhydrolase [Blastococcus saxobsidens]